MGTVVRKLGRGGQGEGRKERDQEGLLRCKKLKYEYMRLIRGKKREC